jgi:hypothetical protein
MIPHTLPEPERPSENSSDLVWRIRGEYLEMPGLALTIEQAARLWSLERGACESALGALVELGFLQLDRDGRYLRRNGGY